MIRYIFKVFLLVLFLLRDSPVAAELVALEDEASSENTGGIAVVLEEFRFQMKNTG